MPLLATLHQSIIRTIEQSPLFSMLDFGIVEVESADFESHRIEYLHSDEPYFEFSFIHSTRIDVTYSPGELCGTERKTAVHKKELLHVIGIWLFNLKNEITAEPLARETMKHRQEIDDLIASVEDIELNKEEIDAILERVTDLEEKLATHIEKTVEDKEAQEEKLNKLHKEFDALRCKAATVSTTKGLARLWGSMIHRLTTDETLVKVLPPVTEVAKYFLTGG